jgi:Ca2+-binding EF-hand superfamily protein
MVSLNDLGGLSSGLSTTNAESLYKRLDPLGKGSLSVDDFATLYAELADQVHQNTTNPFSASLSGMAQPTTFMNFHRTIFLDNFLAVREKAVSVFTQLDTDGSGSVSKQEFIDGLNGTNTTPSDPTTPLAILQTATAQSQAFLAKYDTTGKGYLTQDDLTAAYKADPTLGDVNNVAQIFSELDINKTGHISAGDLNTNAVLNEIATQLQGKFGTGTPATISIGQLTTDQISQLPWTLDTLKSWSSDQGATLTNSDLMNGVLNDAHTRLVSGQSGQDANGDGVVTLSEVLATELSSVLKASTTPQSNSSSSSNSNTTPSSTPSTSGSSPAQLLQQAQTDAKTQMAVYDTTNQGYFTLDNVVAAWTKDPTLGDPTTASSVFQTLDLNNDGQITQSELVAGNFASNIADQFAALMTGATQTTLTNNGTTLPLSTLDNVTQTLLPWTADTIKAWDTDGDGALSRQEIMKGALDMAQRVMATYDVNNTGQFTKTDVQSVLDNASNTTQTADAVIKQWDANGDGNVTFQDVMATTLSYLEGLTPDKLTLPAQSTTITSQSTLTTAQTWASNVLSLFDTDKKGYITLTDIANLYAKQPSLGDVTQAADTLNQWDIDGDGQVTQAELAAFNAGDQLKTRIMNWLDPQNSGSFSIGALTSAQLAAMPYSSDQLKSWDTNNDGTLSSSELATGLVQDATSILNQYDTSKKGYFTQADIQAVLDANPTANQGLTAQSVMSYWDINGDGQVNMAEILSGMNGYITDNLNKTPVTPNSVYKDAQTNAQTTMNEFDTSGQGFITAADVAAAYTANSSLGDPTQANSTIAAWDLNGDQQVTYDELVSGIELSGWANSLLSQLDPTNQGSIDVASLSQLKISMPAIPNANQVIAGWDENGDGKIDQTELVAGLRQQANQLIATFDLDKKGYFTLSDVQGSLGSSSQTTDPQLEAGNIMSQWDIDQDGRVTLSEALAGLAAGQAPPAIAGTTTPSA